MSTLFYMYSTTLMIGSYKFFYLLGLFLAVPHADSTGQVVQPAALGPCVVDAGGGRGARLVGGLPRPLQSLFTAGLQSLSS